MQLKLATIAILLLEVFWTPAESLNYLVQNLNTARQQTVTPLCLCCLFLFVKVPTWCETLRIQ